jgi:hypothetical protein
MEVGRSEYSDKVANWLFFGLIISITFFHKFALSFGDIKIFLGFVFILMSAAFGFMAGRLEIRKINFAAYTCMGGVLALTQLLGQQEYSFISLLFLLIVHTPYIFGVKPDLLATNSPLIFYQKVMVLFAVLGVIQYFAQFVVGVELAFPIDHFLSGVVMPGYNALNSLAYGSEVYKATAVFMLEPAMLCQYLAIAIVVEMIYFKNLKRIAAYLCGIAVTFSGTGLILLFILAPIYLILNRQFMLLMGMLIVLVTSPLWAPVLGLERTLERAGEFTSPHSSGYARFISIFPTLDTYIVPETQTLLFGLGAGSIYDIVSSDERDYEAFNPSWGKMVFEYGVIGGLAYFLFIGFVIARGASSWYVKAALFLQLMLLGEYILAPMVHVLILAFIVWPLRNNMVLPEAKSKKSQEVLA